MSIFNPIFNPIDNSLIGPIDTPTLTVIFLRLVAGDKAFNFELQRALGGGSFKTIGILRGSLFNINDFFLFDDTDVFDGTLYRYRGRHVRPDALDGPFSTPINAIARITIDDGDTGGGKGDGRGRDDGDEIILLSAFSPFKGIALL